MQTMSAEDKALIQSSSVQYGLVGRVDMVSFTKSIWMVKISLLVDNVYPECEYTTSSTLSLRLNMLDDLIY
jgi:hypothetical protein